MEASRPPAESSVWSRIIAVSASFNVAYLMLAFLLPVYATVHLHFSLAAVGFLTALPSLLQLPMRIVSGALTDSLGERPLLLFSFGGATLAGLLLAVNPNQALFLVLAQTCIGFSRGLYWVPMQSYVTRLPGDRARHLGLLSSYNNAGSLAGIIAAGPLAAAFGFRAGFGFTGLCALVAMAFSRGLPPLVDADRQPVPFGASLAAMPRALTHPVILIGGALAMVAAVPQALVQSFYPVYLTHLGQAPAAASALTSLRSVGMVVAGFITAWFFRALGHRRSAAVAGLAMAGALALTALHGYLGLVACAIFAGGVTSGLCNVLGLTVSTRSGTGLDRGAIFALNNAFFALAMLLLPLLFGLAASHLGLESTFVALGVIIAVIISVVAAVWGRAVGPQAAAGD